MQRKGFGAIDMLIGLVITSILVLISINALKGTSSLKINGSTMNKQSVQEYTDQKVNEIENLRQQSINYNKEMMNDENY